MLYHTSDHRPESAEGSKGSNRVAGVADDPFIDSEVGSQNVMPIPPSKPKKVYLEDFENFTVK
jgi:hypothetical protein